MNNTRYEKLNVSNPWVIYCLFNFGVVARITQYPAVGLSVNNELERIRKEAVML